MQLFDNHENVNCSLCGFTHQMKSNEIQLANEHAPTQMQIAQIQ
jgi:Zn ribbon nucleic-acid-binding protein